MFALDCDIYRGTQACLWSGYSEHFCRVIYYDRSLWYTRKRTRGYRVILTLNFFLHHIIRKRENKLCQSPACRYHVLLSNFHDMRCNTWNIKKKSIQILWMIWWNCLTPVSEPQHVQAAIWVFAEEMEFNFISLW